jgi:Protein of unknown function (DUF3181)
MSTSETIGKLATDIGESVYIDIAKWHLYLNDAKLHIQLAEKFMPELEAGVPTAAIVTQMLQSISIPLGGGKSQLPLSDLIPASCQTNLLNILVDFQRDL